MIKNEQEIINAITVMCPDIDWNKFFDADRALNWELWHGTLPDGYWTEVEPLEFYEWKGFEQASKDIPELLGDLPDTIYYDCDAGCIIFSDPEQDLDNWFEMENGNWEWCGPEYQVVYPRLIVMHHESFKQLF